MEEKTKINITFETLYNLLLKEKKSGELQEIDSSFFEDLLGYLKEKQKSLTQFKTDDLIFSVERQKKLKEITNIKNLVKDILEKREQKITDLAFLSVRTGQKGTDLRLMLAEEKSLYTALEEYYSNYKRAVLDKLFVFEKPDISLLESKKEEKIKKECKKELLLLRFKLPVPQFVDNSGEIIGPFREDDVASLPYNIAEILIEKERAEQIQEE
jgi:DNA replication initiation complex subunit (GINS family)